MGLFGKGKKKEDVNMGGTQTGSCASCSGSSAKASDAARFMVLGACCDKSRQTFENAKEAVKELGLADEVVNIGDPMEIAQFGVMQTPALVINHKVVSYGKPLSVEEIKRLMEKAGI